MNSLGHRSHAPRLALLALTCLALAACQAEPEPPTLRFSLTTCLGDPVPDVGVSDGQIADAGPAMGEAAARCRAPLVEANACFVATAADGTTERRDIRWQGGGVALEGQTAFNSGQMVTSAIFFGLACGDDILPPTKCDPDAGCLLKLGPVEQRVALEGETVIDFTVAGACTLEMGALANDAANEVCNGFDDDCDGEVDEAIRIGEMCMLGGIGRCNAIGDRLVCNAGERACGDEDGPVVAPLALAADADCNGVDDDCDGEVDEDMDCTMCEDDNDCNQPGLLLCVGELCRACDPGQQRGCPPEQPVCDANTATCRLCTDDDECDGGEVCTPFSGCTACDPMRPETCPDAALPVCDGATFTCRPCRDDLMGDCPQGFCSAGRCGGCDPAGPDGGGCVNPSPICDIRQVQCRGCQNDNECGESHPDQPICRGNACQPCEVGSNAGCFDINAPICALDEDGEPACMPCLEGVRPCQVGVCDGGQCRGCVYNDQQRDTGCGIDSPRPFCAPGDTPGDAACRACQSALECQTVCAGNAACSEECVDGDCSGVRICHEGQCTGCVPGTSDNCDEDGPAPICGNGACRACRDNAECEDRDGARDHCVAGECEVCNPATNAGCDDPALPACRDGECRRCNDDAQCRDEDATQCLNGGRCAFCDSNDDAAVCPSEQPICEDDGSACRRCESDAECGADRVCTAEGTCQVCDPTRRDADDPLITYGCNEAAPVCVGGTACRGCDPAVAGQCPNGECLADGRCEACNPDTYARCGGDPFQPICAEDDDPGTNDYVCRGCRTDDECGRNGLPPVCDSNSGRCVDCQRRGDAYVGCEDTPATPICRNVAGTPTCVICQSDQECISPDATYCVGGRCGACDPVEAGGGNAGCVAESNAPVCDNGPLACIGCRGREDCRPVDPERLICALDGRCLECEDDGDCDEFGPTPRCNNGTCVGCDDSVFCGRLDGTRPECLPSGQCAACNPDTHAGCGGFQPICNRDNLACQRCTPGSCPRGNCNPNGNCVECDPDDAGDCVLDEYDDEEPSPPVCEGDRRKCVPCTIDDDCAGHIYGPNCVDGLCACDAGGLRCDLASRTPVCDDGACVACDRNPDCDGNPFGDRCRGMAEAGACR